MTLDEKRKLIYRFDDLVRTKARGSTQEYANRLGVSRSTFFRLLDYMREELKAPIRYHDLEGRYYYEREGALFLGFLPFEIISKEDLRKVNGGGKTYTIQNLDNFFLLVSICGTECS